MKTYMFAPAVDRRTKEIKIEDFSEDYCSEEEDEMIIKRESWSLKESSRIVWEMSRYEFDSWRLSRVVLGCLISFLKEAAFCH
jgi:hypothetical protein